jgi:Zn-finger nucleic acid-binding protein
MKCPRCNVLLNISMRQDVETDVCPDCRGVWLDRGELDKIINRYDAFDKEDERRNYADYEQSRRHEDHPRRKSFWHDFFD